MWFLDTSFPHKLSFRCLSFMNSKSGNTKILKRNSSYVFLGLAFVCLILLYQTYFLLSFCTTANFSLFLLSSFFPFFLCCPQEICAGCPDPKHYLGPNAEPCAVLWHITDVVIQLQIQLRPRGALGRSPTFTPVLMAHPVVIGTDGPALLRLAAGGGLVLHKPGTTHSSTRLFKGTASILCLPGGKRGKVKPRLSEQLLREQKHNVDALKYLASGWQSQPSTNNHTQQCRDFIPTFLVRYGFVCFVRIKLHIS